MDDSYKQNGATAVVFKNIFETFKIMAHEMKSKICIKYKKKNRI